MVEIMEDRTRRHVEAARETDNPAFFWSAIGATEIAKRTREHIASDFPERAAELPEPPPDPALSPLFLDYVRRTARRLNLPLGVAELANLRDGVVNYPDETRPAARNANLLITSGEGFPQFEAFFAKRRAAGSDPPSAPAWRLAPGMFRELLADAFRLMSRGWNGFERVVTHEKKVWEDMLFTLLRERGHTQREATKILNRLTNTEHERTISRRRKAATRPAQRTRPTEAASRDPQGTKPTP